MYFRIHRAALWILGEYCEKKDDIQSVMTLIRQSLGEVRQQSLKTIVVRVFMTLYQNAFLLKYCKY